MNCNPSRAGYLRNLLALSDAGEIGVGISFRPTTDGDELSIYCPRERRFYWATADPESGARLEEGCRFVCTACGFRHWLAPVDVAVEAGILSFGGIPPHAIRSVGDAPVLAYSISRERGDW